MGTQVPKKPNWWVLGAFGGGGEAVSSGKKAKLHSVQLKRLSCTQCNLVPIPTSAVYVWHDGTQARLLQARELARLQGLPDNFVLPEGRVVATRLIGNAVPPGLIRALLL